MPRGPVTVRKVAKNGDNAVRVSVPRKWLEAMFPKMEVIGQDIELELIPAESGRLLDAEIRIRKRQTPASAGLSDF